MKPLGHPSVLLFAAAAACAGGPSSPAPEVALPPLPDAAGWGVHVLALEAAPDSAVWAGTYGRGIYVLRPGARTWEHIAARAGDSTSISWDFVNAFAFPADGSVWYGTVGNGFGRSTDGGRTWRNWTFSRLGPEWQYVAPRGIRARGDSVYIATADGLRMTWDGGRTWRCVQAADRVGGGAKGRDDRCGERVASLPTEYLLGLEVDERGRIWVRHHAGVSVSDDAGASWRETDVPLPARRSIRFAGAEPRGQWGALVGGPRNDVDAEDAAAPFEPLHTWFERPVLPTEGNPYIDQTYRYGSTMGGNFQQHQGIEFNNAAGTPVRAVGDGTVVFAGEAEAGARTVAILHDRRWRDRFVYSVYFHNTALDVRTGQRVSTGEVIARVGNTGRATNDHLHLEIHVAPAADSAAIVNPAQRFPPHTVNPQLWLRPLPGTGIVAGKVTDAAGRPVPQARVYGLRVDHPDETPFAFAETYGDRARPDPAYGEHFAVGDVPAGTYLVGADIAGRRVWRRVRVQAGKATFVEFMP